MRFLTLILIVFSLLSCNKVHHKVKVFDLHGDYEWFYSFNGPFESISYPEVEDQYGLRIKDSGKMQLFKNGIEEDAFRIVSMVEYDDKIQITYKIDKWLNGFLYWDGEILTSSSWPFENNTNEFLKTSE